MSELIEDKGPLGEILELIGSELRADVREREAGLRLKAREQWAALNGFKIAGKPFYYPALTSGAVFVRYTDHPHEIFDHAEFYRTPKPHLAAAIIAHLYNFESQEKIVRSFAAGHGLQIHIPPVPTASWYYPRWTTLVCYTKPGVEIRWLPWQSDIGWLPAKNA